MDFQLMIEARKEIERHFDKIGVDYNGKDTRQILVDYFSLKHKLISKINRQVLKPKHLDKKITELNLDNIVDEIIRVIVSGQDLNPYLSKGTLKPQSHDFILNDWKLHHLHLNNSKDNPKDYFNSRADFLLFIHVDNDKVYFIDIVPHKDKLAFAHKDFIRIIRDNWNDLHSKFLLADGSMQLMHNMSEEEIAEIRKKRIGLSTFTQVDNLTYFPGLSSATSGHSVEAMRNLNAFHRTLWDIQQQLNKEEANLKMEIEKVKGIAFDKLDFTLRLENDLFRVFENNSQCYVT